MKLPNDHQAQVKEFMQVMGQDQFLHPDMPTLKVQKLRIELEEEEFKERIQAVHDPAITSLVNTEKLIDVLVPIADAIGDILYVVYGDAVAHGIDIHLIFDIIHKANMQKLNGPISPSGKRLKPAGWQSPHEAIREELRRQILGRVETTDEASHLWKRHD